MSGAFTIEEILEIVLSLERRREYLEDRKQHVGDDRYDDSIALVKILGKRFDCGEYYFSYEKRHEPIEVQDGRGIYGEDVGLLLG